MPQELQVSLRAQADAERTRRAKSPVELVSALQPYIDEELAHFTLRFGEDERHLVHATSLAISRFWKQLEKSDRRRCSHRGPGGVRSSTPARRSWSLRSRGGPGWRPRLHRGLRSTPAPTSAPPCALRSRCIWAFSITGDARAFATPGSFKDPLSSFCSAWPLMNEERDRERREVRSRAGHHRSRLGAAGPSPRSRIQAQRQPSCSRRLSR